jgi:hypothetical protein
VYLLRVFRVYNKVADSGDVVIQEQGFSIVDTHGPAIAIPLPLVFVYSMDSFPHKNQIFPVGRHQEARRFLSPGLHHITSVSHCEMSRRERHTSTLFGPFLPSPATLISHQQAFRTAIYIAIGVDVSGRRGNGAETKTVVLENGGKI